MTNFTTTVAKMMVTAYDAGYEKGKEAGRREENDLVETRISQFYDKQYSVELEQANREINLLKKELELLKG